MLKQYDYYGYGEEEVEAAYDEYMYGEEYDMEMAEEEPAAAKSPVAMAFVLVPVLDLGLWYLTDDFLGTKTSDEWKNVKNSALFGGIGKAVVVAGFMAGALPMTMGMPIKALSAVHEIVNIVLVNKAENKMDSDKSNAQFGCAIAAGVISLAAAAASKPAPAEEEMMEEEMYYEEDMEGEGEEEAAADDYYGYY